MRAASRDCSYDTRSCTSRGRSPAHAESSWHSERTSTVICVEERAREARFMIFKVRVQCSFQVFSFFRIHAPVDSSRTYEAVLARSVYQRTNPLGGRWRQKYRALSEERRIHWFSRDAALARSSLIFFSLSFLFTCYASIVFIAFQFFFGPFH